MEAVLVGHGERGGVRSLKAPLANAVHVVTPSSRHCGCALASFTHPSEQARTLLSNYCGAQKFI